jgi:hypothetical protein
MEFASGENEVPGQGRALERANAPRNHKVPMERNDETDTRSCNGQIASSAADAPPMQVGRSPPGSGLAFSQG